MSHLAKKMMVVNVFGGLFYMFCMLQWLWATLPYLPGIMRLLTIIQPTPAHVAPITPVAQSSPPSLLLLIVAGGTVTIMLGVTVYILFKLPSAIAKTGHKITKRAADYAIPVVSRHAPLTPKTRRRLTARVLLISKLLLCTLPVAITAASAFVELDLAYNLLLLVAAVLWAASLALLGLQIGSACLLNIPRHLIR